MGSEPAGDTRPGWTAPSDAGIWLALAGMLLMLGAAVLLLVRGDIGDTDDKPVASAGDAEETVLTAPGVTTSPALDAWARRGDRLDVKAMDALVAAGIRPSGPLVAASPASTVSPVSAASPESTASVSADSAVGAGSVEGEDDLRAGGAMLDDAPRLAIVIDDWGYPWASADGFLDLPVPLTVAVIPHLALSEEHARRAAASGHEVILHLPMEPLSDSVKLEPDTIRVGMSPVHIIRIVHRGLASVEGAVGVNNHMGSRATGDAAVMHPLLADVGRRGLFFLDSATSPRSVAARVAAAHGVPLAVNQVFLDHDPSEEAVARQLRVAMDLARKEGQAVAIGHVRPGTYAALVRMLPEIERAGIRLVHASDLVAHPTPDDGPGLRRWARRSIDAVADLAGGMMDAPAESDTDMAVIGDELGEPIQRTAGTRR